MEKYILVHAYFEEDGYELHLEQLGVYCTAQKAKKAMEAEFRNLYSEEMEEDGDLNVFRHTDTEIYSCFLDQTTDRFKIYKVK